MLLVGVLSIVSVYDFFVLGVLLVVGLLVVGLLADSGGMPAALISDAKSSSDSVVGVGVCSAGSGYMCMGL